MTNSTIRIIAAVDTLAIRHRVLWPSLSLEDCRLDGDDQALHFGLILQESDGSERLVCVATVFMNGTQARLRKFATLADYQGQGLGSRMLTYILDYLSMHKVTGFWCDARTSAVEFYQRFGLQVEGEPFAKRDQMYVKMRKPITATD